MIQDGNFDRMPIEAKNVRTRFEIGGTYRRVPRKDDQEKGQLGA